MNQIIVTAQTVKYILIKNIYKSRYKSISLFLYIGLKSCYFVKKYYDKTYAITYVYNQNYKQTILICEYQKIINILI